MISLATLVSALGSSPWRKIALALAAVLLLAVLCGLAAWRGYSAGYSKADAVRLAEVRAAQLAHAEEVARHASALAAAEGEARKRIAAEVVRARTMERQYLAAQKTIAAQRRAITKERIANASRTVPAACRFGPEWVRVYNAAIGARAGDGGDAVPSAPAVAHNATGTAPAADAGVLRQVTPADVLAHIRDYGARCQAVEAQLAALIDWAEGRTTEEVP